MRTLVLACLVALAGCIIDNDPVRVENFTADTPAAFTYDAWTLTAHGMCAAGYVVETRRFVQPWDGPFGNGGDIFYSRCCL